MNEDTLIEISEEITEETNYNSADIQENSVSEEANELNSLREQVKQLKDELSQKSEQAERVAAQLGELYELFPEADVKALPDEVWESVKRGTSLAAAYALYARKASLKDARAREINQRNTSLSTGSMSGGASSEFFTPEEVKSMSRAEVKANYSKIIESMKRWN